MNALTIWHGAAKPIRVRGRHVCALVDFAERYRGWHTLGKDRTTRRALQSAMRSGCIMSETLDDGTVMFQFTYPQGENQNG